MITERSAKINAKIRKEYEGGKSMKVIGDMLGISAMAVCARLKRMGVKVRVRGNVLLRMHREIREQNARRVIETWKKHIKNGEHPNYKELSTELKLAPDTIGRILRREADRIVSHS